MSRLAFLNSRNIPAIHKPGLVNQYFLQNFDNQLFGKKIGGYLSDDSLNVLNQKLEKCKYEISETLLRP